MLKQNAASTGTDALSSIQDKNTEKENIADDGSLPPIKPAVTVTATAVSTPTKNKAKKTKKQKLMLSPSSSYAAPPTQNSDSGQNIPGEYDFCLMSAMLNNAPEVGKLYLGAGINKDGQATIFYRTDLIFNNKILVIKQDISTEYWRELKTAIDACDIDSITTDCKTTLLQSLLNKSHIHSKGQATRITILQDALNNSERISTIEYDGPPQASIANRARLNQILSQQTAIALKQYNININNAYFSLAMTFFKAIIHGTNRFASSVDIACDIKINTIIRQAKNLPKTDEILDLSQLFMRVTQIAHEKLHTENFNTKLFAASLLFTVSQDKNFLKRKNMQIDDAITASLGMDVSINDFYSDFSSKLNSIEKSIQQACGQNGITRLIFENYFLEYLFDFQSNKIAIDDIPSRIKEIFQVFLAQLQPILNTLPTSTILLWRLGHLLFTQGDQLFLASSTREITTLFLEHNAHLNRNGTEISQQFLTIIGDKISPVFLKKNNNQTCFKDREDLEQKLQEFRYKEYAEWASYFTGAVMTLMIILMATKVMKPKSENYVYFAMAMILSPALGFLHRILHRIEPQKDIEKTLDIYSKKNGPQIFSAQRSTDDDIDASNPNMEATFDRLSQV